ncbi:hypothetical protein NHX12_005236 [Muraenolepis orangiensis]|uniref:Uncharacterized protein n=1 Tax=Muraenolepis orangiensis TaxID=630683 RepID=A0A9Q0DR61_9TELE|nr:hypothetical protein NHX12_005236 [Muraenolepis orangiensis]
MVSHEDLSDGGTDSPMVSHEDLSDGGTDSPMVSHEDLSDGGTDSPMSNVFPVEENLLLLLLQEDTDGKTTNEPPVSNKCQINTLCHTIRSVAAPLPPTVTRLTAANLPSPCVGGGQAGPDPRSPDINL